MELTNRWLDINEVTANASTIIGGATQEDRLLFQQWVANGLIDLGPASVDVKVCILYPKNGLFHKPKDLVSVIDIGLFNSTDEEIKYTLHTQKSSRIHADRNIHSNLSQEEASRRIDLAEDSYYFYLGSNRDDITYAQIRYYAMPIDRDGYPLVHERDLEPLMMYCRYMWSLRKNDNRSEIDQNRSLWYEQRDRAKGRRKMPSMLEADAIARRWLSMVSAYRSKEY